MLIIGCGDVGLRIATFANPERELYGIVRSAESAKQLQQADIHALQIDMDADKLEYPAIPPQAQWVYLTPPPRVSLQDERIRRWLDSTPAEHRPARFVYISTSGVYGDHQDGWVTEDTPVNPQTDRAQRRVDAETVAQQWCEQHNIELLILRVPGIIGAGRDALTRLQSGEPILHPDEAPFTNVVDADYLAQAILFVAAKAESGIYNIADRPPLTVTERALALCKANNIPVPPFITMAEAEELYSPMRISYLQESRRLNCEKLWAVLPPQSS